MAYFVLGSYITSLYQLCPSSASIRYCSSRKLPRNRPVLTVCLKIFGSSFSHFHPPFPSTQAVEVLGIHHRAIHSFRTTKGDSAEFSAEV
ncbi:hypothetical protein Prudu_577S000400 [Prunus dulcis]|uniref:Uncharacterized protein n=1 Tax=Prunus dulcis TaxID=3755 RepID=A0A5H2XKX9_PRUDU|nr:hypothetical protein Prudu_577S000400 [Prunus dulcis]